MNVAHARTHTYTNTFSATLCLSRTLYFRLNKAALSPAVGYCHYIRVSVLTLIEIEAWEFAPSTCVLTRSSGLPH